MRWRCCDPHLPVEVNVCPVYTYDPRGKYFMIRFHSGTPHLCACIAAVLLSLLSGPGPRAADEPRAFRVEGDILGAHDPSIIRERDTWYLFAPTPPDSPTPDQFPIRCSKDLTHWKACGYVFSDVPAWIKRLSPKTKELWAPDISFFDGKFHLYYAYSAFGVNTSGIALLTNKTLNPQSPDYHWTDEGLVLQSRAEDDFNAIDPNLILDEKGQAWLDRKST